MKKMIFLGLILVASLMLVATPVALAYQEGSSPWWYIDASYGSYHNSVPLVIEINGNPADVQIFNVGETITITCDLHSYAGMAGWANEAYTEWELEVSGANGISSDDGWEYDYSHVDAAEVETIKTLTITYSLITTGIHTVYMNSYAAVAYDGWDAGEDTVEAWLTFEVVEPVITKADVLKGNDVLGKGIANAPGLQKEVPNDNFAKGTANRK